MSYKQASRVSEILRITYGRLFLVRPFCTRQFVFGRRSDSLLLHEGKNRFLHFRCSSHQLHPPIHSHRRRVVQMTADVPRQESAGDVRRGIGCPSFHLESMLRAMDLIRPTCWVDKVLRD